MVLRRDRRVNGHVHFHLTAERLAGIPHGPGVYVFTHRGIPLYVGKAADLHARLGAYRTGGDWKPDMLREATGLRVTRTDSELEALLLEANWIKADQPKYNIANRDGKSFLYIGITDEEFPQVLATRRIGKSGTYVGPFTSAYAVRETLRALRKIFPFRCRTKPIADSRQPIAKPCLYFHMGLCVGTCAGLITAAEYRRRVIVPLTRLLEGKTTAARRLLDPDHRQLLDSVLAHTRVLSVTEKYANDIRELQRVLGLSRLPHRIEGYDISNIHGIEAVGSMVVALDGEPAPSEYKRFKIRTLEGKSDDVGMLREVLQRRLSHSPTSLRGARDPSHARDGLRNPKDRAQTDGIATPRSGSARNDKKTWPLPDLLVIDGGKPQLNAVLRALSDANDANTMRMMRKSTVRPDQHSRHSHAFVDSHRIPVVALAKREEEIYLPGQRNPLRLPGNSPALHLLQRVRDEAHRFAVGYHRQRRSRRMFVR